MACGSSEWQHDILFCMIWRLEKWWSQNFELRNIGPCRNPALDVSRRCILPKLHGLWLCCCLDEVQVTFVFKHMYLPQETCFKEAHFKEAQLSFKKAFSCARCFRPTLTYRLPNFVPWNTGRKLFASDSSKGHAKSPRQSLFAHPVRGATRPFISAHKANTRTLDHL